MTIQDKMDSAQVYADYAELAADLITYVDEEFDSASVIADANTVLRVLSGITQLVAPIFGYVGIENKLTNMMYRLTIDEDYEIVIEPIGDAKNGYEVDILGNYTLCSANVPLSVCKFLDNEGVAFEIFDIADEYEGRDGDCKNCEYFVPIGKSDLENEDKCTYELEIKPGIDWSELESLPNISINISGDAYINYYNDYKVNCDD